MRKITVFYGPQNSGKTLAWKQKVQGRKYACIVFPDELYQSFQPFLNKDTEVLVIEEVRPDEMDRLKHWHATPTILVNHKGKAPFWIPCPDLIITVQCDIIIEKWKSDFFDFIECNYKPERK